MLTASSGLSHKKFQLGIEIVGQLVLEKFLSASTMQGAENELIRMGSNAIPILGALFKGETKNDFGVPYRNLGLALSCGLETVCRLGEVAKQLEPLLVAELLAGQATAARALASLCSLDQASIAALANSLDGELDCLRISSCACALSRSRQRVSA